MASTFYTYTPLLDTTPAPYDKPGYVCEVINGGASAAVQGHPASHRSECSGDVKAEQDVSRFLGPQDCGYDASPDEDLIFTEGMLMNFMDDDSLLPNFRSNMTSDHQAAEDVSQHCFFPFSQQGTQASTEHMSSRNARPIPGGHLTRTTLNFDELESVVSGGSGTSFDDSARDLTMNCPANLFSNDNNTSRYGSTRRPAHLTLESQNSADASYLSYGGVMPPESRSTRSRFPAAVTTPQSNMRPPSRNADNCDASLFSSGTRSRSGGVWPKPHQSKEARKHKKAIAAKKYRQERNEYVKELENKNQELTKRVSALEAQLRDFLMASQTTAEMRHQ